MSYERTGWLDDQPSRLTGRLEVRPAAELGPIIVCLDTSGSMYGAREVRAEAHSLWGLGVQRARACVYYFYWGGASQRAANAGGALAQPPPPLPVLLPPGGGQGGGAGVHARRAPPAAALLRHLLQAGQPCLKETPHPTPTSPQPVTPDSRAEASGGGGGRDGGPPATPAPSRQKTRPASPPPFCPPCTPPAARGRCVRWNWDPTPPRCPACWLS